VASKTSGFEQLPCLAGALVSVSLRWVSRPPCRPSTPGAYAAPFGTFWTVSDRIRAACSPDRVGSRARIAAASGLAALVVAIVLFLYFSVPPPSTERTLPTHAPRTKATPWDRFFDWATRDHAAIRGRVIAPDGSASAGAPVALRDR